MGRRGRTPGPGSVSLRASEGGGDGGGAGPSMESLFAKELAKRGVDDGGVAGGGGFEAELRRARGTSKGGAGAPGSFLPGLNADADSKQLERSRLLNSEGLEGLPARAGALLGLGVNGLFIRFLPLALATALMVVACQAFFGEDFIHGGTSYRTPLVDPYELLAEDEASMTPFSRGSASDQYGIFEPPPSPQAAEDDAITGPVM